MHFLECETHIFFLILALQIFIRINHFLAI
jgi:hypothetical protein